MPAARQDRPLPLIGGGVFFSLSLLAASAEAGDLRLPVDCRLGEDCFIQQYVDRDPGPGSADFTCGTLSYDGHKGTDFRLVDDRAMAAGVDVLAAAPGVVRGRRDGVPDVPSASRQAPEVSGRECGNGVLVERDDGWTLQYCHMRRGSVRVAEGERVETGQVLGQVGLSGQTEFPHLHLTVRDPAGRVIDPFDARRQDTACALEDTETLWAETLAYAPGGVLGGGFLERVPDYGEVKAGRAGAGRLGADAPALVFWAHFYGVRTGDRLELTLTGPDGAVLAWAEHVMDRDRATEFRAIGRKARAAWPAGAYRGTAVLTRKGAPVDRFESALAME